MTDDLLGRQTQHLYHLLFLKLLSRQDCAVVFSISHVYIFLFSLLPGCIGKSTFHGKIDKDSSN